LYDVVEFSQDLDSRARHGDEDGLLEEQEERKRRERWNNKFLDFVREMETMAKSTRLEFDKPYPTLAFQGVTVREMVAIVPTVHCLVALDDSPPLCITLEDVEIACFERVQFGLKSFDLAFIFKDYNRSVVRIDQIPAKYLDALKEWLNSCNILFYETKINIIWKNILKVIQEDPKQFFEDGGWNFLDTDEPNADQEELRSDGEAPEESASDFEPEESAEEEDSDEYNSEEDASDASIESGSAMSEDDDDEVSDWDELEKQAAKEDKEKRSREVERNPKGPPKKRVKK